MDRTKVIDRKGSTVICKIIAMSLCESKITIDHWD